MKQRLTILTMAVSLAGCASVGETPAARSSMLSPETLGAALQVNASLDMTDQRYSENGLIPKPLAGTS